jgi:SAM-dependent methyltransferase
MDTVQTHYNVLLGPVYTWMAGGLEAATARNRQLLTSLGLDSWPRGLAVDLGCGSGFQSIPLAEAGYRVMGLDLCASLLVELGDRTGALPIRTVHDDLLQFPRHLDAPPHLIVCMGDTLTHLPSRESVARLIQLARQHLVPGGRLVLGFRDLASHELKDLQRFIPVRHERDRIFTCFLDYQPDKVVVHDLLHTREGSAWKFTASAYPKLRLSCTQVALLLTDAGFSLEHSSIEKGLVHLVAQSPSLAPAR